MGYEKAIPGEFQHALVIADIDKKKIRNVVRRTCAETRKITLLKDGKISKRLEEKVTKLVDIGAPNLRGHFKDGVSKGRDEVCGKKRGGEAKEMHGGGKKTCRRQFQERKMYTRQCIRIVLMGMRGGTKHEK